MWARPSIRVLAADSEELVVHAGAAPEAEQTWNDDMMPRRFPPSMRLASASIDVFRRPSATRLTRTWP